MNRYEANINTYIHTIYIYKLQHIARARMMCMNLSVWFSCEFQAMISNKFGYSWMKGMTYRETEKMNHNESEGIRIKPWNAWDAKLTSAELVELRSRNEIQRFGGGCQAWNTWRATWNEQPRIAESKVAIWNRPVVSVFSRYETVRPVRPETLLGRRRQKRHPKRVKRKLHPASVERYGEGPTVTAGQPRSSGLPLFSSRA